MDFKQKSHFVCSLSTAVQALAIDQAKSIARLSGTYFSLNNSVFIN